LIFRFYFHAGFDGSFASKQNQARAEQELHPGIRHVSYQVETKLDKNIFSFKIISKEESQLISFPFETTRRV